MMDKTIYKFHEIARILLDPNMKSIGEMNIVLQNSVKIVEICSQHGVERL